MQQETWIRPSPRAVSGGRRMEASCLAGPAGSAREDVTVRNAATSIGCRRGRAPFSRLERSALQSCDTITIRVDLVS